MKLPYSKVLTGSRIKETMIGQRAGAKERVIGRRVLTSCLESGMWSHPYLERMNEYLFESQGWLVGWFLGSTYE